MPRRAHTQNPADIVLRPRLREHVQFSDLSERLVLKIASATHYTARAHFGSWHRRMGAPDFESLAGVFTPLVHVDIEVATARLAPAAILDVRGETFLARVLDDQGATRHLAREGRYLLTRTTDGAMVARVRLVNFFTRYDPDPEKRRITTLPEHLGLGTSPSRLIEVPTVDQLTPRDRSPDMSDAGERFWHYGQTDPNRHINSMDYLCVLEEHVASHLARAGHDVARLFTRRARLAYRKPCFSGEGYRRLAWFCGEAPLIIGTAVAKSSDASTALPAVAAELTLAQHDEN
jgi:hypothetical protein